MDRMLRETDMQNNNEAPTTSFNAKSPDGAPEVTGALLSRMLTSMQDLGDAARALLR